MDTSPVNNLANKWQKLLRARRSIRQAQTLVAAAKARGRTGPACLIVNLAQMGDIILSAGIAAALRDKLPHSPLVFAAPAQWVSILEGDPVLDGVVGVHSLHEARALARSGLFQTTYILDIPIPKLLGYFDGVPGVFRYDAPTTADWFTFNRPLMSFYEANAGLPGGSARPRVWLRSEDRVYADNLFSQHKLSADNGPIIALHTHSSMAAKNWPADRFAALVSRWHAKHGASFVVIGGLGEGTLLNNRPGVVHCAGQLSVKQTAAVIARSDFFVGPDSGLAYVAEAMQTPGLIILGATVPETSGPRDASFSYIRPVGACLPACHRACDRAPLCITSLDVDTVDAALERAWQAHARRQTPCAFP